MQRRGGWWAGPAIGLALWASWAGGPAAAQPAAGSPEQRKALEALALADARAAVLERINALPLGEKRTVGDWAAADVERDRALRLWARRQPRYGETRVYSDDVAEADIHVPATELRDELVKQVGESQAAPAPAGVSAATIRAAAAGWQDVWVTGRGVVSETGLTNRPVGWENVTHDGMELARRAATADAFAALFEEAGRLTVMPTHRLAEFFASSDAVRGAVRSAMEHAAVVNVEFAPDQVAVGEARLAVRELLRILTRVHQELYQGTEFSVAEFREMTLRVGKEEIVGSGLATPPAQTLLRARPAPRDVNAPAWVDATQTARGQYVPDETPPPDEATRAQLARVAALDALQRDVLALPVQGDVNVAQFLAYHPELKDDVTLFISGAHPSGAPRVLAEAGVEIAVEVPLRRLWEILRRAMTLEEVAPPPQAKP